MRSRETTDDLLRSQRNLTRHTASARPAIIAFVKQRVAEFQGEGGKFRAPKMMRGFASFNAATKIINLSRSEMADAKLAALVEVAALMEGFIHYQQAQAAGVFGKERGWLSRYTLQEWQDMSPLFEAEVDEVMTAMGFEE